MLKKIQVLFLILIYASTIGAQAQQVEKNVYMFSYFKGNGEDGLHLAYSYDGYQWDALKNDSSFLTPTVSNDKLMRDPCIIRGADNIFHMVWTVSWTDKGIGYASSPDLVNWSEQKYIPVMADEPDARNCWAPEITYDPLKKQYMIYWATTIPGRFANTESTSEDKYNHRMYYVLTKDFKSFSEAKILYDQGFNVIDATIQPKEDGYAMILKDETLKPVPQKNLHVAFSKTLTEGYGKPSSVITGKYWAEGPTILKIDSTWIVYFDKYKQHKYGAVASTDFENWTDVSDQISFPEGTRHGTVFSISESEFIKWFKPEESKVAYLAAYMTGDDEKHLYYAIADSAFNFKILNEGNPILSASFNDKLIRDPMIFQDKEGMYHLVATVSWKNRPFTVWDSKDLVNWENERLIDVAPEGATKTWAPEFAYDKENDTYFVYWTAEINNDWSTASIYYSTTKDFVNFSVPKVLYKDSDGILDANIINVDGKYHLIYRKNGIWIVTSNTALGPYTNPYQLTAENVEGPYAFPLRNTPGYGIVWDYYGGSKGFGLSTSTDFKNWQKVTNENYPYYNDSVKFPAGIRHGSIMGINQKNWIDFWDYKIDEVSHWLLNDKSIMRSDWRTTMQKIIIGIMK